MPVVAVFLETIPAFDIGQAYPQNVRNHGPGIATEDVDVFVVPVVREVRGQLDHCMVRHACEKLAQVDQVRIGVQIAGSGHGFHRRRATRQGPWVGRALKPGPDLIRMPGDGPLVHGKRPHGAGDLDPPLGAGRSRCRVYRHPFPRAEDHPATWLAPVRSPPGKAGVGNDEVTAQGHQVQITDVVAAGDNRETQSSQNHPVPNHIRLVGEDEQFAVRVLLLDLPDRSAVIRFCAQPHMGVIPSPHMHRDGVGATANVRHAFGGNPGPAVVASCAKASHAPRQDPETPRSANSRTPPVPRHRSAAAACPAATRRTPSCNRYVPGPVNSARVPVRAPGYRSGMQLRRWYGSVANVLSSVTSVACSLFARLRANTCWNNWLPSPPLAWLSTTSARGSAWVMARGRFRQARRWRPRHWATISAYSASSATRRPRRRTIGIDCSMTVRAISLLVSRGHGDQAPGSRASTVQLPGWRRFVARPDRHVDGTG